VAGAAGQRTQGEIARGIYATVTSLGSAERWHSEALRLQLSSLALAQAEPMDAAAAEALLGRLRALRQSVGVTE